MKTNILSSYKELKEKFPLDKKDSIFLKKTQKIIKNIFLKKDKKLIVFMGPCSLHDETSIIQYANELKTLQKDLKNLFLIMRVFFEKSRSANSWKGFLYDPNLDNTCDIKNGLIRVRKLLLTLTQLKVPTCCEFLEPNASYYFNDLISWGFIGARTCYSNVHRHFASSLSIPIGFKNPLDGDISSVINAAIVAKSSQNYISINNEGKICQISSDGNILSHIVLRGSNKSTNFDEISINNTIKLMKEKNAFFPIIIDCAHGNAKNDHNNQIKVFKYVITNLLKKNYPIIGLMLESHLNEGKQSPDLSNLKSGLSITDPCISLKKTKELILFADDYIKKALPHL
jgi:3-deoxy-7-phosphoheptulonate synthase